MTSVSSIWFRTALRAASLILVSVVIWNRFAFPLPGLSTSSDLKPDKSNISTQKHPYFRARSVLRIHGSPSFAKGFQMSNPRKRALLTVKKEKDEFLRNGTKFVRETNATSDFSARPLNNDSDISSDSLTDLSACQGVRKHIGFEDSCAFIRAHAQCRSGGFLEYADFFFCGCKNAPLLGYALLAIWLMALFYMLGNTAADYFCSSLEKLSSLLQLPPTVAGVTLLPLGNGAPDVFASIAAFVGAGAGEVGLNSVLGGAVFVTSVVAGSVCLLVAGTSPRLDQRSFIRDVCFFLGTLLALFLILFLEQINLWGALAFVSIYVFYAITVAASECLKRKPHKLHWHVLEPVMCHTQAFSSSFTKEGDEDGSYSHLMDPESEHDPGLPESSLPQWMWVSHNAIFSHQAVPEKLETSRPLWGWNESHVTGYTFGMAVLKFFNMLVEYPLILPRRLTIPIVEDDRWSRFFAVASVILAPILLAWVVSTGNDFSVRQSWFVYAVGVFLGVLFGFFAFFTTIPEHPPRRFLFPWVAGGFVMSIVWFYIIATELVSALVGMGVIFEIDPAILGLTVLAWGNSIGDLMANLALASNGGDGVQIALSGCYAGPMFNTLLGLGISLVLASWNVYPAPFLIPKDGSLFHTLAFLVVGLLWSLFMLPKRQMQPTKLLGVGLLLMYGLFLSSRIAYALGLISIAGVL